MMSIGTAKGTALTPIPKRRSVPPEMVPMRVARELRIGREPSSIHRWSARALLVGSFAALAIACGPPPAPAAPVVAQTPSASASAPAPRAPSYSRDRDPMSASFDREKNPFTLVILAKLWVAVAKLEAGEGSVRLTTADQALLEAQRKVAEVPEPCVKDARIALAWAAGTKQSLERRYLSSVDLLGEQNIGSKIVDAEVVVLRDEIDALERRMKSCPKQYFAPEER